MAGDWVNSLTDLALLDSQLKPGLFVRCWIEGQPSLQSVKTPSVATFYILKRDQRNASGIDCEVVVVGARAASLLSALEAGPFPRRLSDPTRATLHACLTPDCVNFSCLPKERPELSRHRVHAVAFQVCYREDVTERWCAEGLATLETEIARGGAPLPPFRQSVNLGKASEEERREKARLAAQTGAPGNGRGWEEGRLRDPHAAASSAETFGDARDASRPRGAQRDRAPGAPPFPPSVPDALEAADATLARALREAQESQDKADAARIRLDHETAGVREKTQELDKVLQKSKERLAEIDAAAEAARANIPPTGDSGRGGRSRDRRPPQFSSDQRPGSAPPFVGTGGGDRGGEYTLPDRRGNAQDLRLPPVPTIRMDGFTHGAYEGDTLGRKAGTYGDQVPTFRTHEVLAWLQAQFDYSNKCREVAMADMRERRRKERAEKREERFGPYPFQKGKEHKDDSESDISETDKDHRPRVPNQAGDPHRFRAIARETPGVLFANLVAEYRGQLGQFGYDMDVGPHGPVFRKWSETVFPQHPKFNQQRLSQVQEEFDNLIFALDELRCGRILELADILAQRLRQLCILVETNNKAVASQVLPYSKRQFASCTNETFDVAVDLAEAEVKRARKLARLGSR